MTLENTLLQKLGEWKPPGGRQTLTLPDADAGWTVSLTVERQDELSCQLWEMTVVRTLPPPATADALRSWADRAAGRVTGLLEPLKVVEVDVTRREALLRSDEPAQRGPGLFYYDVLLQ